MLQNVDFKITKFEFYNIEILQNFDFKITKSVLYIKMLS